MNQDELREAVLAALLDYETLKKERRYKAVKKALQGTMVATVIGSTSLMAASNQGRNNQARDSAAIAAIVASSVNTVKTMDEYPQETSQLKIVPGVLQFALNQHALTPEDEGQLIRFINQLPKDAELTVIGCTDSIGGQLFNKKLGIKRAQAVADYLTDHGVKIKSITNMISKNKHAGWLARRVDVVVNSALSPLTTNLPPAASQPTLQSPLSQPEPQTAIPEHDYRNKDLEMPQLPEKTTVTPPDTFSSPDTATNPRSTQQVDLGQLHLVVGVTHYALNSYKLASAHKERLMELIKQLPQDAQVTVIGRTDSQGIPAYNKNLGMQRAKTVANFLASRGVKIKAVGTKVSNVRSTDWMARRVDVVVDSAQAALTIHMPPPVAQ